MRLVGSGLRTLVVTLDPKRNELQTDAPGGDAAQPRPRRRGRRLRSRRAAGGRSTSRSSRRASTWRSAATRSSACASGPSWSPTRILLCIEVGAGLRARSRDGRRRLHPDAGQRRRAVGAAAPAARARQAARARRCRFATARSCSTARCGRPTCAASRSGSRRTSSSCCASSPIGWAACSRGRSCCRASGATATSAASAPSTRTC